MKNGVIIHNNEKGEIWKCWNPTNIECRAFCAEIVNDEEGLIIMIDSDLGTIKILFKGHVPIYTYSTEGIRMSSWAPIQKESKDQYVFRKWFLFKIENSNFLKWAIKESQGFYQEKELMHFCIITGLEVIDILSSCTPEIMDNIS